VSHEKDPETMRQVGKQWNPPNRVSLIQSPLSRQDCNRLSGIHRVREMESIEDWMVQNEEYLEIGFDKMVDITTESDLNGKLLIDSNGLRSGTHEWTIEVLRADVDLQEIGVIGTSEIESIEISENGHGVLETNALGQRAVYGSRLNDGVLFYGSVNEDGTARCSRDLRPFFEIGWTVGDLITVKLNLDKWRIKFSLNGKSVRYAMSLDPNKVYYPMVCCRGNCKYALRY